MLLEEHPGARVIIVSSLAYEEALDEALEVGAKGFLDKPFDRDKLLEALNQAMAD